MSHDDHEGRSRRAILDDSWVLATFRRLSLAAENSVVHAAAARVSDAAANSRLVDWLTKEPEPEVIVIDLRETWTIGPVLAVLDRLLAGLSRAYAGSRVRGPVERATTRFRERPIRVVSGVLFVFVLAHLVWSALVAAGSVGSNLVHLGGLVLAGLGLRETRSWTAIRRSAAVELLRRLFEPPAPATDSDHD